VNPLPKGKARFIGRLREILGKEVEFETPISLKELIESLPEEAKRLIYRKGKINIIILINDRPMDEFGGLSAILKENDVVAFIPPVGGG
jgi:molybdopterin converting factor small subunit